MEFFCFYHDWDLGSLEALCRGPRPISDDLVGFIYACVGHYTDPVIISLTHRG